MIENECCICLNNIEDGNIFRLECCKQIVHHDCIVNWINTNIDRELPDYNKCILCKSYNKSIDDYYNDLLTSRRTNTYLNLDNSNNQVVIIVTPENIGNVTIQNNRQKIIVCSYIFTLLSIFTCVYLLVTSG